jgi:hypothetical protein
VCGGDHVLARGEACPTMRAAAAADARPPGVPPPVHAGYLEAREAMKRGAPARSAQLLRGLLELLAAERGVPPESTLEAKLQKLCDDGVISPQIRDSLSPRAVGPTPECAWALMSIVEHAFYRLYLRPPRR